MPDAKKRKPTTNLGVCQSDVVWAVFLPLYSALVQKLGLAAVGQAGANEECITFGVTLAQNREYLAINVGEQTVTVTHLLESPYIAVLDSHRAVQHVRRFELADPECFDRLERFLAEKGCVVHLTS